MTIYNDLEFIRFIHKEKIIEKIFRGKISLENILKLDSLSICSIVQGKFITNIITEIKNFGPDFAKYLLHHFNI